jgi:hypothetical protein
MLSEGEVDIWVEEALCSTLFFVHFKKKRDCVLEMDLKLFILFCKYATFHLKK